MGWSIDTAKPEVGKIFREAKRRYRMSHPQSSQQTVTIEYTGEDELQNRFKQRLAELFPDFVYINFVFVQQSKDVIEQGEWDN